MRQETVLNIIEASVVVILGSAFVSLYYLYLNAVH